MGSSLRATLAAAAGMPAVTAAAITSSAFADDHRECKQATSVLTCQNLWRVQCDRCKKWRRLSEAAHTATVKDDEPWFCEANPDTAFASCDVPQEESQDD